MEGKHPAAALIVSQAKKPKDDMEEVLEQIEEGETEAAKEMMEAVKDGDAEAVKTAMGHFYELCSLKKEVKENY